MANNPFKFNLGLPDTPQVGRVDKELFLEFNRIYLAIKQLASKVEELASTPTGTPPSPPPPVVTPPLPLSVDANTFQAGPRNGEGSNPPTFRRMFPDDFPLPAVYTSEDIVVINWKSSNTWSGVVNRDTEFRFFSAPDKEKCTLIIVQDAVGSRNISLPSNVRYGEIFPESSVEFPATPNSRLYLGFIYDRAADKYDLVAMA